MHIHSKHQKHSGTLAVAIIVMFMVFEEGIFFSHWQKFS